MSENKTELNTESNKAEIKKNTNKYKPEVKYTKAEFLRSSVYDRVLVETLLENDREYTKAEFENLAEKFKRGEL